jgi:hypothetical protein
MAQAAKSASGEPVRSPRKGARIPPVSELSAFLKVKPGREQAIREVFNKDQATVEKAVHDVGTLHQARYVLFDDGTRLLLATTFDGDWDVYIDDFEGYPDEGKATLTVDDIKEFLTANQVTAAGFYVDYPGVTNKEIHEALRVQAAVQESLDNPEAGEALQHPALKPLREVAAD